jgi:predicted MFS family arabinose efflux permease
MRGRHAAPPGARVTGFRDALRSRAFRAVYLAETASILGDQLARVALAILVFDRTGSASATALTYALTFLPAILGGAVLSDISDRLPRRLVLVGSDVVRGALVLAMLVPGMPVGALLVLLAVVVFVNPAFTSAEVAFLSTVLEGDRYRAATGLRMMTNQLAQVAGFAVGGAVVALLGPRWGLALDAVSYGLSALLIATGTRGTRDRRLHAAGADGRRPARREPVRSLFRDPRVRALVALIGLAGFFVIPEGLAAPYVATLGGGAAWVGVLMAALPLGSVLGTIVVLRRVGQADRGRVTAAMAVLTGVPLVACWPAPGLPVSAVLWLVSGALAAYLMDAMTSVVQLTREERRGRFVGIVGAGLLGVQGIGLIVFGYVAAQLGAHVAVGLAGAVGTVCAVPSAVALWRHGDTGHRGSVPHQDAVRRPDAVRQPDTGSAVTGTAAADSEGNDDSAGQTGRESCVA